MLTVKQILSTGTEKVFEASSILYEPANAVKETYETLYVDDGAYGFFSGLYYVMNDAGNTVAKYDLGPEPKFD